MRRQVKMSMTSDNTVTISFHKDNSVTVEHSDNRSKGEHKFEDFDSGREFFLQMIGALYVDGYR